MAQNEKPVNVYRKPQIIKRIARSARIRLAVVEDVYDALERELFGMLSEADGESGIELRMFDGLSITSEYVEPHEKINNITGELITTKPRIKPKASFTRNYREKLIGACDSD